MEPAPPAAAREGTAADAHKRRWLSWASCWPCVGRCLGTASRLLVMAAPAAAPVYRVVVWDCGSRSSAHGAPRALWHGLALLRFVLVRSWWGVRPVPYVKGHNLSQDFEAVARGFSQRTSRRIKHYRQFVAPGAGPEVALYGAYRYTPRDGDVAHWVALAQQHAGQGTLQGEGQGVQQAQGAEGMQAGGWGCVCYLLAKHMFVLHVCMLQHSPA